MLNPINIAKSSTQFIYTKFSNNILVDALRSTTNSIYTKFSNNILVDALRSTTNSIYTKFSNATQSFSNYFFVTPKENITAIDKKGQGQTEEEIFERDNSDLCVPFSSNLDQVLETGVENDKLPLPLSSTVAKNPINIDKEQLEKKIFLKELEELTLTEMPKSNLVEEIVQRNETINARLKKFNREKPLPPLTPRENPLEEELNKSSSVDWRNAKGPLSVAEAEIKAKREVEEAEIKARRKVQEVAISGRKEVQEIHEKKIKAKREAEEAEIKAKRET